MAGNGSSLWNFVGSFARAFLKSSQREAQSKASSPGRGSSSQQQKISRQSPLESEASPGQYGAGATRNLTHAEIAQLVPSYSPSPDGDPDPGEIVWTWVPYEENDGRGKDRPVLIIARVDTDATAGCYLSTKQHRDCVSIGTGGWDSQGRESFLAPDRILRVTDQGMRREGHVLSRERFIDAAAAVVQMHGIPKR